MSVFEKVKKVIVEELSVKDPSIITEDTDLAADLGADSLDAVEIIMSLEEEFDLQINDEEAQNIKTVGDLVRYIENNK